MTIDNFDILMKHMDFVDPNDRYIVHVMRRPKDCKALANQLGASEAQRLIRTYYIDNIDYLKSKIPAIKELCKSCNARAYLIVSPKNNFECLLNLGKKILDVIQNKDFSVKPEHLLRQAYCENHKTRKKRWIIDLDNDEMVETWVQDNCGDKVLCKREWTLEKVQELVKKHLKLVGKSEDEMYTVPTKHGWHIITPPVNLMTIQKECNLIFEGREKQVIELEQYHLNPGDKGYTGSPSLDTRYKNIEKEITGWLHKDGMTLLFFDDSK